MKRAILLSIITLMFILGCATTSPEETIGPPIDKPKKDDGKVMVACLQERMAVSKYFLPTFKLNNEMPEFTVYAKGTYHFLDDETIDDVMIALGRQWHECYPLDTRTLTIWVYDSSGMMLNVAFVSKADLI